MSPLLFNCFIDTVVRSLLRQAPNHGITIAYRINGRLVHPPNSRDPWSTAFIPLLLYADDIVLLSSSPGDLTVMFNKLQTICIDLGLTMNHAKTETQSLGHPSTPAMPTITTVAGATIHPTLKFKYLGSLMTTPPLDPLDAELVVCCQ